MNYEEMTVEEKREWDIQQDHLWKVELPAQLAADRQCAEQIWTTRKMVWSWIGDKDWQFGFLGWFFLKEPARPCRRFIRFSLPDSGQLRVMEKFVPYHDAHSCMGYRDSCKGDTCYCHNEPTSRAHTFTYYHQIRRPETTGKFYLLTEAYLLATAEIDGRLHHFRGTLLDTPAGEMNATAMVFSPGTPQIVADRCAKIFQLTMENQDGDTFYALLDGTTRCAICRHKLCDEISKLVAVGPDCAQRYGIPHSLEAASKRLELRKKLLSEMQKGEDQ
jgi:hypothetical protein